LLSSLLHGIEYHEKRNGSGCPQGLLGVNIPPEGRIVAITDVYATLISACPLKKSFTADEAAQNTRTLYKKTSSAVSQLIIICKFIY